jgi:salicylate hydroxylase
MGSKVALKVSIAGGGIGGLAGALALARAGQQVDVYEKAPAFTEAGAGIQLGPNATALLQAWGLSGHLQQVAFAPEQLQVRSATSGQLLGQLTLGKTIAARYGAPYVTLHRADLHALLLAGVQQTSAALHANCAVQRFEATAQHVTLQTTQSAQAADVLVAADGLWSATRQQLLGGGLPARTGHLAYRALIQQTMLPERLRSHNVTAWLGPNMHAVQYPVRGGEWLNMVVFIHGDAPADFQNWDHSANAADLGQALQGSCGALHSLIDAIPSWRLWTMFDRPPLQGPHQMAQGRVALLGDAAHPMRPYLAQGAGMAIEDAAGLALALNGVTADDAANALQHYAAQRWQRNARVQARALRNGQIFHARGPMRWGRDAAMKLMGERLLDMPWLYEYRQST